MKTYAIGDLHGRFDLLCKAIDAVEQDSPEGGKLVILGDFVDRGPNSAGIIKLLRRGPQKKGWEWVILQGNHEAMMVECIAQPGLLRWWFGNGGTNTLMSYGYSNKDQLLPLKGDLEDDLAWLATLPVYIEDEHRIYVHAGVPHDQKVSEAKPEILQWMLYPGDVSGEAMVFDDQPHASGKHVVHGHHQSITHPLLLPHRTNLDGFAWASGICAIGVFEGPGGPEKVISVAGLPPAHMRRK